MIGILDYNAGNIGSVQNMIKHVGGNSKIIRNVNDFDGCSRFVLPGVGAFDFGMKSLRKSGLIEELRVQVVENKKPILGICLGAQLLTKGSDEGALMGLGWLDAFTKKFVFENTEFIIPHMGWNTIKVNQTHPIMDGLYEIARFYFVHSYYLAPKHDELILTSSEYGFDFSSGLCFENIVGLQFHPEKSHKFGMRIFKNFINWDYAI